MELKGREKSIQIDPVIYQLQVLVIPTWVQVCAFWK